MAAGCTTLTALDVPSTILGKRKLRTRSILVRLSPISDPPSSSESDYSNSSEKPTLPLDNPHPRVPSKATGHHDLYKCEFEGCGKAYKKLCRLEEHERSHTGEVRMIFPLSVHPLICTYCQRPFVCNTCGKSYLRDTHLQAHKRSHLPDSARPLECPVPGCQKRFWTNQHLRAHRSWHDAAKPFVVRPLMFS